MDSTAIQLSPEQLKRLALGHDRLDRPRVRGHEIFYNDGGKQGYRTLVAFDPKRRLGVVLLANARSDESLPTWGRYLLTGEPLPPPPAPYPVRAFVSIGRFRVARRDVRRRYRTSARE